MRKFYGFGLLMLLPMTLCGIAAVAQKKVTVDNIVYEIYDDWWDNMGYSVAVVANGDSATGNVEIPAEVEYEGTKYPVVCIGSYAFQHNTAITSVKLPTSVNMLDYCPFYRCTSLVSITGGTDTFDYIGQAPLYNTPLLATIPAEDGLKYWKGWVIAGELPNGFEEARIKEGTIGVVPRGARSVRGKTLYLPKSFRQFNADDFHVDRFVVDKENPTLFVDDYGAVYQKNGETYFYSSAEKKEIVVKGQTLYRVPTGNTADTFVVPEGTVAFGVFACAKGIFERIIVPEGCEIIRGKNFYKLTRCKYIELPSTLKYFELEQPTGDSQLEIVLKAKEVPETTNSDYRFFRCTHVTLYVPKESLDKYLADPNYNGKFKEIKAIPDDAPLKGDVNGDEKVNAADVTTVYNYIANPEATGLTLDKVDINGDGNVNATDITDLYNIIQAE